MAQDTMLRARFQYAERGMPLRLPVDIQYDPIIRGACGGVRLADMSPFTIWEHGVTL